MPFGPLLMYGAQWLVVTTPVIVSFVLLIVSYNELLITTNTIC
ncbi:hypothetical protein GGR06_000828 [Bacteroides reticulotermitis]|uniref:Uncharacterized protein n=1 Tax=Bacteroides reticulotermitis TaxID=1133319 RepID=A0A840D454_9BACE|nr:hypothetical protein [Bacteroides reticulotermitis]